MSENSEAQQEGAPTEADFEPALQEDGSPQPPKRRSPVMLFFSEASQQRIEKGEQNVEPDGGIIPVMDGLSLMGVLANHINQVACQMALEPGLSPEPTKEEVKTAAASIGMQIATGELPEEARFVDPATQLKYQLNVSNMVSMLVSLVAGTLKNQYKAERRLVTPDAIPGSAILRR